MSEVEQDYTFPKPPHEVYTITQEQRARLHRDAIENRADLLAWWVGDEATVEEELRNTIMAVHDRASAKQALDMLREHQSHNKVSQESFYYQEQTGLFEEMIKAMDWLDENGYSYDAKITKEAGLRARISSFVQSALGRFLGNN